MKQPKWHWICLISLGFERKKAKILMLGWPGVPFPYQCDAGCGLVRRENFLQVDEDSALGTLEGLGGN